MRQLLIEKFEADYEIVGEAADGNAAIELLRTKQPRFALVDIDIPEMDGIAVCNAIAKEVPSIRLLLLSSELDPVTIHRVFQSEADGYVDKVNQSMETIHTALDTIRRGRPYYTEPAKAVRTELRSNPEAYYKILSKRELELMPLFCKGHSDEEIAAAKGFSKHAAHWHRTKIIAKLNLHGTIELIRYGREIGFWR